MVFTINKIALIVIMLPFLVGYRIYPGGNNWGITTDDPTLYLSFCSSLEPTSNDVDSSDSLHGQTANHNNMVGSLLADFNNVTTSFVRLADSGTDSSFDGNIHGKRIITICTGDSGSFDGYAEQKWDGDKIVGCSIKIKSFRDSAKKLLRIVGHEIGHCLGLDHDQSTKHALMSYFSDSDVYRLQGDDKAGLTKLYSIAGYSQSPTFGASCEAKK